MSHAQHLSSVSHVLFMSVQLLYTELDPFATSQSMARH